MKYHTNAAHIIISLGIFFGVCAAVSFLLGTASLPTVFRSEGPAHELDISNDASLEIQVGSVKRTFLESIALNDVTVTPVGEGQKPLATAKTLSIGLPVTSLLFLDRLSAPVAVAVDAFAVDVDVHSMPGFVTPKDGTALPASLPSALSVTASNGTVAVSAPGMKVHATDVRFVADIDKDLEVAGVDASAQALQAESGLLSGSATALNARFSNDDEGEAVLDVSAAVLKLAGSHPDWTMSSNEVHASYVASDMNRMLELTGAVNASIGSVQAEADVPEGHFTIDLASISAEGVVADSVPISVSTEFSRLHGTGSYGQFNDLDYNLPAFRLALLKNPEGYTGTLAGSGIDLFADKERVAFANRFDLDVVFNPAYSSFRLDSETIELYNTNLVGTLLGDAVSRSFDQARLDQTYLLLTVDHDRTSTHAEFSTSLGLSLDLPLLDHIETTLVGQFSYASDGPVWRVGFETDRMLILGLTGALTVKAEGGSTGTGMFDAGFTAMHDAGILISGTYDNASREIKTSIGLDNVAIGRFEPLFIRFGGNPIALFGPSTTVGGNISASFDDQFQTGRVSAELGLAHLVLDRSQLNLATTLTGSFDQDRIEINRATFTTENIRFSYSGFLNRQTLFPEGLLSVQNPETGDTLLSTDFYHVQDLTYGYAFSSPLLASTALSGMLEITEDRTIRSQATLIVPGGSYPLSIVLAFADGVFDVATEGLALHADLTSNPGWIQGELQLDAFRLPPFNSSFMTGSGSLDGRIDASYGLADGTFTIASDSIKIGSLQWSRIAPWEASASFSADNTSVILPRIVYKDSFGILEGSALLSAPSLSSFVGETFAQSKLLFSLKATPDSQPGESLEVSLRGNDHAKRSLQGLVSIGSFRLGRVLPKAHDLVADLKTVGTFSLARGPTDTKTQLRITDPTRPDFIAEGEIDLDDDGLTVEPFMMALGTALTVDGLKLRLPIAGQPSFQADVSFRLPSKWRDNVSNVTVGLNLESHQHRSVIDMVSTMANMIETGLSGTLSFRNARFFDDLTMSDLTLEFSYDGSTFSIQGLEQPGLYGYYRTNDHAVRLEVPDSYPISFRLGGTVRNDWISLTVDKARLPLTLLNPLFPMPIFLFASGIGTGWLSIEGPLADPDYFGTLQADSVGANVFFAPGQTLSMKNPVVTVSQNTALMGFTPVTSTTLDGLKSHGYLALEFAIEQWAMPTFKASVLLPDEPISLWVPIAEGNINLEAQVKGFVEIAGDDTLQVIKGDLVVDSGTFSFEIPALPDWFKEPLATSTDITITTGKNALFAYPSIRTPIVQAVFNDNQKVRILYDAVDETLGFEGRLAFRSGEIYYIQKNFYITEGGLSFSPGMSDPESLNAFIDLRARIQEFDASGNKVDIFLVLENSSLDNIKPRFESTPLLSTNEILEILGQGMLGSATYQENGLSSVVALASVATDMASRLGLIDTTVTSSFGFSALIRDSLGLDVFTIRSNLLQNILFDALPGTAESISLSPMAKYLDNTTLYIGKYLLDELYLQGMVNLRAAASGGGTTFSFLANDMEIDTELSLEWTNPLAVFSIFTKPEELSVFNILDTIGFSVTKRIVF